MLLIKLYGITRVITSASQQFKAKYLNFFLTINIRVQLMIMSCLPLCAGKTFWWSPLNRMRQKRCIYPCWGTRVAKKMLWICGVCCDCCRKWMVTFKHLCLSGDELCTNKRFNLHNEFQPHTSSAENTTFMLSCAHDKMTQIWKLATTIPSN